MRLDACGKEGGAQNDQSKGPAEGVAIVVVVALVVVALVVVVAVFTQLLDGSHKICY